MEDRTLYTLEERLRMAARSQASSPEAAARLVEHLGKTHILDFMDWGFERMVDFFDHAVILEIDEKLPYYRGFCHAFRLAAGHCVARLRQRSAGRRMDPFRPIFGVRMNNAIVLLGLLLLDHAKGRMRNRTVYHCTRMTLGQYLDALEDLSFRKDGTPDQERAERRRTYRDAFFKDYDESRPMKEALADILGRYVAGWRKLTRLDHVLNCMGAMDRYAAEYEEAGAPLERSCALQFFEDIVRQGPEDVPDFEGEAGTLEGVADRLFLPERDYSPGALREQAAGAHFPEMRAVLEEQIGGRETAHAMREINKAVASLYILFVSPYLEMEEYHYERPLRDRAWQAENPQTNIRP